MVRCGVCALLLAGSACVAAPDGAAEQCSEMCSSLVLDCGFAAYPSVASCEQGCLYNAGLGAFVGAQQVCVELAACDPFAVMECEHAYGID